LRTAQTIVDFVRWRASIGLNDETAGNGPETSRIRQRALTILVKTRDRSLALSGIFLPFPARSLCQQLMLA
jgi:hypothetical protein